MNFVKKNGINGRGRGLIILTATLLLFNTRLLYAEEISVAVASNFYHALTALASQFEKQSSHVVKVSRGSSGKLYAQIMRGAPYQVFFSADKRRPKLLENNGVGVKKSRKAYAFGRIALWYGARHKNNGDEKKKRLQQKTEEQILAHLANLSTDNVKYIAIANPKLAPYGRAALQVLIKKGGEKFRHKIIMGENIGQAFHFVAGGAADVGIVALAQLLDYQKKNNQLMTFQIIPNHLHEPIEQQYIVLNNTKGVSDFIDFLRSDFARKTIKSFGYGLSE